MDALEFVKEYNRMCDIECSCYACDYRNELINHIKFIGEFEHETCLLLTMENPEFSVKYLEQWSKEHPKKTRLQDLLEKYPNAPKTADGTPRVCAAALGYINFCEMGSEDINCKNCWNQPLEK